MLKDPGLNLVDTIWLLVLMSVTATGFKKGLFAEYVEEWML